MPSAVARATPILLTGLVVACGSRTPLDTLQPGPANTGLSISVGPRCATDAATPTVLYENPGAFIEGLALDDSRLYWVDASDTAHPIVQSMSKCGGDPLTLGPTTRDFPRVAVRGGYAYWPDGTWLVRAPGDGGPIENVLPLSDSLDALALDDVNAYVVQGLGIRVLPLSGATPIVISTTVAFPLALAIDSDFIYFPDGQNYVLQLFRAPKSGGAPQALTNINYNDGWNSTASTTDLVTDGQNAYWGAPVGGVWRVARDGSSMQSLAQPSGSIHGIAVDETDVFFVYADDSSAVTRLPKAGGEQSVLAEARQPTAIAVDTRSLYWVEQLSYETLGQRVMKLDK